VGSEPGRQAESSTEGGERRKPKGGVVRFFYRGSRVDWTGLWAGVQGKGGGKTSASQGEELCEREKEGSCRAMLVLFFAWEG